MQMTCGSCEEAVTNSLVGIKGKQINITLLHVRSHLQLIRPN